MTIRPPVQHIFDLVQAPAVPPPPAGDRITVSAATTRIAFAYERFRNTLEPDEEDILRRKSIWRILARRVLESNPEEVSATALLQELLRAHYITIASRPMAQAIAIELHHLRQLSTRLEPPLFEWFLQVAAVSIDQILYPHHVEEALVHVMYHDVFQRLSWEEKYVPVDERPTQLFLACHRTLFAAADDEISYHYFLHHFPQWKQPDLTADDITRVALHVPTFYKEMQNILDHPARQRLVTLVRPVAVPYRIIWDMCQSFKTSILTSPTALSEAVEETVKKRSRTIARRMSRRAWHSILFLLLTKILLTFIIELPYERFFLKAIHWPAVIANTTFHPLLLFFVSTFKRLPGKKNTRLIVEQVEKIVTGDPLPSIVLHAPRRYSAVTWSLFAVMYTALFMLFFWGLFTLLLTLNFSLPAMFLFVTFLGLVSFLATRVRHSADDIRVLAKREGAMSLVFSFVALPLLEFGGWLTRNIRQLNVLLFLMDRVLEAPFKLLIDVTEEWFSFVRERREEIV